MTIPEIRQKKKPSCPDDPHTSIYVEEDRFVVRTSNGHTVQYNARVFTESVRRFVDAVECVRRKK